MPTCALRGGSDHPLAIILVLSLVAIPVLGASACSNSDAHGADSGTPPVDADAGTVLVPHALTANDVSVLFPLSEPAALWPADLEGKGGPLLPRATFARIGRSLLKDIDPADAEYAALRVVAVRFDPCFGQAPCVPQLRLVLQAIDAANRRAHDGAVHLHYNLTDEELGKLASDVRALTTLAPENADGLPLGPSPSLTNQGVSGTYGTALRALVTRYAGAANLSRMTFMTRTTARAGQWEFGGVNLKWFSPEGDLPIAGLPAGTHLQTVASEAASQLYRYSVTPATAHPSALSEVMDGEKVSAVATEALAAAHEALARLENPTLETPGTADCASCHLANRLRGYLDQKSPQTAAPSTLYAGRAQAIRVLGSAETNNDSLRAFGYFDSDPVVSQRIANETHRVLELFASK